MMKPEDVVVIESYEDFLTNAHNWMKSRNLDKVKFDANELKYNVATEYLEGAEAIVKASLLVKMGREGQEVVDCFNSYIDSLADSLVFVVVDSFKEGFPSTDLTKDYIDTIELPEVEAIINPIHESWLFMDSTYLYFTMTSRAILRLGYSPFMVFTEVFKEISTRRGSYSEAEGKWIKKKIDPSLAYTADFNSSIIHEDNEEFIELKARLLGFGVSQSNDTIIKPDNNIIL